MSVVNTSDMEQRRLTCLLEEEEEARLCRCINVGSTSDIPPRRANTDNTEAENIYLGTNEFLSQQRTIDDRYNTS